MSAEHATPPQDPDIFSKAPDSFEELLHKDRRTAEVLLGATTVSNVLRDYGIQHCFIGGVGVSSALGRAHRRIKDIDLLVPDISYYDTMSLIQTMPGTKSFPIPGAEYVLQPPTADLGYISPDGITLKLFQFNNAKKQFGTERHGIKIQTEIDPAWDKKGDVCDTEILHAGVDFLRFTKLHQLNNSRVNHAHLYDARLLGLKH